MILDHRLIRSINAQRCFALVGSGPSCEIGYPSWAKLAELTLAELQRSGKATDERTYTAFMEGRKYPELFRQAELDAGGRAQLVDIVKPLLKPTYERPPVLYKLLAKWPFCCYLTTNYDNEIFQYLQEQGQHFTTVRNSPSDLSLLRDGASRLIVKLHSDFEYLDGLVLTSRDYDRFTAHNDGKYFQDRLGCIMQTFDVCVIGHSLNDSDLAIVLQKAKEVGSAEHPIFMIAADFTPGMQREFHEKYNIIVESYDNADGTHAGLRSILSFTDRFITPRRLQIGAQRAQVPPDEVEAAVSLLLYGRLQSVREQDTPQVCDHLAPLVLRAAASANGQAVSDEQLLETEPLATLRKAQGQIVGAVTDAVRALTARGFLARAVGGVILTDQGANQLSEVKAQRRAMQDKALGQFATDLRSHLGECEDAQVGRATEVLMDTLSALFRSRGLTIANKVFASQAVQADDLSDLFKALTGASSAFPSPEFRAAFIETACGVVTEPTAEQAEFLAALSQGYFLYHMLGIDPVCSMVRQQTARDTAWICDSNLLISLLAQGAQGHDFASDLVQRLREHDSSMYTTRRLLTEVWEHLKWAASFVRNHPTDSNEFLSAALAVDGYKQNLFIDGFVRLSAEGRTGTFRDYLSLIFPERVGRESFEAYFTKRGIGIVNVEEVNGFRDEHRAEITKLCQDIRMERQIRGTYRSPLQVEAEAEVLRLVGGIRDATYRLPTREKPFERVYFLSPSRTLDSVPTKQVVVTWTPEALYRYLLTIPGAKVDLCLLCQSMITEGYYAGIKLIDRPRYGKFFGPAVQAARLSFAEQKEKYLADTERRHALPTDEAFEATPDLEKPFFVAQMGWQHAEEAERAKDAALKRAAAAEARAKQLEAERASAWDLKKKRREKQEDAERRNLRDPDHVKKKLRQAKKRAKKK